MVETILGLLFIICTQSLIELGKKLGKEAGKEIVKAILRWITNKALDQITASKSEDKETEAAKPKQLESKSIHKVINSRAVTKVTEITKVKEITHITHITIIQKPSD